MLYLLLLLLRTDPEVINHSCMGEGGSLFFLRIQNPAFHKWGKKRCGFVRPTDHTRRGRKLVRETRSLKDEFEIQI